MTRKEHQKFLELLPYAKESKQLLNAEKKKPSEIIELLNAIEKLREYIPYFTFDNIDEALCEIRDHLINKLDKAEYLRDKIEVFKPTPEEREQACQRLVKSIPLTPEEKLIREKARKEKEKEALNK